MSYKTQLEKEIENIRDILQYDPTINAWTKRHTAELNIRLAKLEGYNQARKEELEFLNKIDFNDEADCGDINEVSVLIKERIKELGEKI